MTDCIDEVTYLKLVSKLQKKIVKHIKNISNGDNSSKQIIITFLNLYFNKNILIDYNNSNLCNLYNDINNCNPPIISFNNKYTKEQKVMRDNWYNITLSNIKSYLNNWNKNDPLIHKFLKELSDIL